MPASQAFLKRITAFNLHTTKFFAEIIHANHFLTRLARFCGEWVHMRLLVSELLVAFLHITCHISCCGHALFACEADAPATLDLRRRLELGLLLHLLAFASRVDLLVHLHFHLTHALSFLSAEAFPLLVPAPLVDLALAEPRQL